MDMFRHLALSCRVASDAFGKHNSIVDGIDDQLWKAHINFRLEEPNSMKNNRVRSGDIIISNYDANGSAYLDVIHTLAQSYIQRAGKGRWPPILRSCHMIFWTFWWLIVPFGSRITRVNYFLFKINPSILLTNFFLDSAKLFQFNGTANSKPFLKWRSTNFQLSSRHESMDFTIYH